MTDNIRVVEATPSDGKTVGGMVHALLAELFPESTADFDQDKMCSTAATLLAGGSGVWGLISQTGDGKPVGLLMLNECAAIYAGGKFGEISEFYVAPSHRSAGVGALIVDAAAEFGRGRGWSRLEVGAPDAPRWQRTVDFYLGYGFHEVGPRLGLELAI
jgi:GNAT superfamily N-acetyltransferase